MQSVVAGHDPHCDGAASGSGRLRRKTSPVALTYSLDLIDRTVKFSKLLRGQHWCPSHSLAGQCSGLTVNGARGWSRRVRPLSRKRQ
jgi:hypothetical protein